MFAYNAEHFVKRKKEGQEGRREGRREEGKQRKKKEKRETENTIHSKTFNHLRMVFQAFEGLGRQDVTFNLV